MEETKKNNESFIKRVYHSIIDFDSYSKFSEEPLSKAIKYLFILVLVYSLIIGVVYSIKFGNEVSKGIDYLNENIEHIEFQEGMLTYNDDESVSYEDGLVPFILVDTSEEPDIEEYKEKAKLYDYGIIILKDKIMVTSSSIEEFESFEYTELGIENMEKEEILGLFNNAKVFATIGIAIFILEFMQYFLYTLMFAIILAVMAKFIGLILRIKISFKSGYIMGIYALTLPTVLELLYVILNMTTGIVIQYFSWMYTTISYIYICVAILMIKTDFLNLRRQMMKIENEEKTKEKKEPVIEENDDEEETKEEKKDEEDKNLKEQTDG